MQEFDLLATNQLGNIDAVNEPEEMEKLLVWHKMEGEGFQPSARSVSTSTTSLISLGDLIRKN
jgi:hypothetical protein